MAAWSLEKIDLLYILQELHAAVECLIADSATVCKIVHGQQALQCELFDVKDSLASLEGL